MTKIAVIGDSHFGVRQGDPDFLEFQIQWMVKVIKDAYNMGIRTVVQVGDMMDVRKQLDVRVGNAITDRILPLLDQYKMELIVITGNHNIFYRDNNAINNLWFMKHHPRVRIITEHEYDPVLGIQFLGWINKNNLEAQMQVVSHTQAKYLFAHLELTDFPMMKGVVAVHGQSATLFKKFDKVVTGHYHTISEIGNVHYTGSPYHLTWADFPDGTNRGWFVFDTDNGSMELIKNTEDQSLFAVHNYDPNHKYEEADLAKYAGKIVRYVVKDKGATRNYSKFLELLRNVKTIEYNIIDETIVVKSEKSTEAFDPSKMLTNMGQIVQEYSEKLAATVPGADVAVTKGITMDLYERANA